MSHTQTKIPNDTIIKKEQIGKRDLARLVDYYRHRVEAFEKERTEWLEKLEGIRISQEESHKLQWELKKRTEEVAELQNSLKGITLGINEERKQIYSLTSELENTKCKYFNNFPQLNHRKIEED